MTRSDTDRLADAFARAVRPAAFAFAAITAVMAWLAMAADLLPANGVLQVLIPGTGVLLVLAGGVPLTLGRPPQALELAAGLVFMEAGFAAYLLTVHLPANATTSSFALSPLKIAIVAFTLGADRSWWPAVTGTIAAVTTELVCWLVGSPLGYAWTIDGPHVASVVVVIAGSVAFAMARRRAGLARAAHTRLTDEETVRDAEAHARARAAAVVHDTALNDLAVLATTAPGPLPAPLAERLSASLALLASPDWLHARADPLPATSSRADGVLDAVERARAGGLGVQLEGDPAALARLDADRERALALAVEQCLTNTQRHAGTTDAEVTVLAGDGEISVLVTDSGTGFDADAIGDDRLGIRSSVRARIEDAGGSVRIFSRPGLGTSILLSVPAPLVDTAAS